MSKLNRGSPREFSFCVGMTGKLNRERGTQNRIEKRHNCRVSNTRAATRAGMGKKVKNKHKHTHTRTHAHL